jgi:hypothetical protein
LSLLAAADEGCRTRAGLDWAAGFLHIAAATDFAKNETKNETKNKKETMNQTVQTPRGRRIIWIHVLTVVSAAILIGAEVFGAAFAAGWAFANLFQLGEYGAHILQAIFFLCGVFVMIQFIRFARRVEPFTAGN